MKTKILNPR